MKKFTTEFYRKRSEQFEKKVDDLYTKNKQLEIDKLDILKTANDWETKYRLLQDKNNKLIEEAKQLQNRINKLVDKL